VSYEILFTDEHREDVVSDFDEEVLDGLETRLEKKQKELDLVSRRDQAGNRFYNLFTHSDVTIAEAAFNAKRRDYRGILILVDTEDGGVFVFLRVIEKEDRYESSEQRRVLDGIGQSPAEIMDYAKTEMVENMDRF
jgi:hypothetical protein